MKCIYLIARYPYRTNLRKSVSNSCFRNFCSDLTILYFLQTWYYQMTLPPRSSEFKIIKAKWYNRLKGLWRNSSVIPRKILSILWRIWPNARFTKESFIGRYRVKMMNQFQFVMKSGNCLSFRDKRWLTSSFNWWVSRGRDWNSENKISWLLAHSRTYECNQKYLSIWWHM